MKKKRIWTAGLFALLLAAGCDNSSEIVEGQEPDKGPVQEFTLMVESDGESYLDNNVPQTRRTASSATPKQTIDKVALVIIRDDNSAEVVYHTTLEGWNDTQNIVSRPYADGSRQGRKAVVTLKEENLLEDGKDYQVYAVTKAAHTEGMSPSRMWRSESRSRTPKPLPCRTGGSLMKSLPEAGSCTWRTVR